MASRQGPTVDRRVQRTRGALRGALMSLMAERGWDDVGVQDICDRANIGRSTFYTHFQSKEQLLEGGLSDLREALRTTSATRVEGQTVDLPFVRGLIDHVFDQHRLFRMMIGSRSGHVVRTRFREMVLQLVQEDIARSAAPGWQRDVTAHYLTGAVFELLVWLSDARRPVPAKEVEGHFRASMGPVLRRLRNGVAVAGATAQRE